MSDFVVGCVVTLIASIMVSWLAFGMLFSKPKSIKSDAEHIAELELRIAKRNQEYFLLDRELKETRERCGNNLSEQDAMEEEVNRLIKCIGERDVIINSKEFNRSFAWRRVAELESMINQISSQLSTLSVETGDVQVSPSPDCDGTYAIDDSHHDPAMLAVQAANRDNRTIVWDHYGTRVHVDPYEDPENVWNRMRGANQAESTGIGTGVDTTPTEGIVITNEWLNENTSTPLGGWTGMYLEDLGKRRQ